MCHFLTPNKEEISDLCCQLLQQLICSQFLSSGETLRPAEEPETLRRDSQTCRGTRDTEERLSDLQRNQRH
ncbi:ATP-dependent zinc metalloprotease FtsH [Dissostichus eleginoides]|uniref:ATP-dependent zinc metalloprotease FtsH n=1 Tax=Dissostichus eleginoides TaxID=100907 RepID=A0AAD9CDH7_DISEL|nr:ATP-dependent zinc metalloprotease FtsH [Dissostichus eleginoides]